MTNRLLSLILTVFLVIPAFAADLKISQLTTQSSPAGGNEIPINAAGLTKKLTLTTLRDWIDVELGITDHVDDVTIHRSINDVLTSSTSLWSSSKINTELSGKAASTHTPAASDIASGTLPLNRGGLGFNTISTNRLLYSPSVDTLAPLMLGASLSVSASTLNVQDNTSTQKVTISKAGTAIGSRKQINFIEGTGISITAVDSTGNDRVDVTLAASTGRAVLTSARTYYVRTDGSDSNTGLVNNAGGAFLTIQKAIDVVADTIDNGGYDVTIQVGNGTYTASNTLRSFVGRGKVIIQGDTTTPANVLINPATNCFFADAVVGIYSVKGFKLTTTGGTGFYTARGSKIEFQNIDFGSMTSSGYHIYSDLGGNITATGNYNVTGAAAAHLFCTNGSIGKLGGVTITFSSSPAITTFIATQFNATAIVNGMTFTNGGTVTATRYSATGNGVIYTAGGGISYLPGGSAGSTATSGQYI